MPSARKDFEEAKGVLQSKEESSKARIAELEEQRGKMLSGRDDLAAKVPKPIIKRYERLKTGITNVVIIIHGRNLHRLPHGTAATADD